MRNVLLWAATLGIVALGWLALIIGGAFIQAGAEAVTGWVGQFGTWAYAAFFVILFAVGISLERWGNRREARRRYAATKTIHGTVTRSCF